VLLRLGVSRDGLPLRLGWRDGHTSDSPETPVAIEACGARGLDGGQGMVADSQAYGQRPLGWCLEQRGRAAHVGPAHGCGAPGGGGVGPAVGPVALVTRQTWPYTPGVAAPLARAPCRPPGGSGRRRGAPGWRRTPVSRRALQPVGPASGRGL
jgi:hypothetical protein